MKDIIKQELQQSHDLLTEFMANDDNITEIANAAEMMIHAIKNGDKIIACGNGGSMSDAIHFASELTGKLREDRSPIPAVAISDPGHITCVGNDYGFEEIFARWVKAHGFVGDVLLAISTSGNSENVAQAVAAANSKGMYVVFLSGRDGGLIRPMLEAVDVEINVNHYGYSGAIQEIHIKIIHILCLLIEQGIK
jgi:D-sedoheptulose 7-phosphate isomerase